MVFALAATLLLLPAAVFGAPHRLVPVKRAVDTPNAKRAYTGGYIVSIKANTVKPANRGNWLNGIMADAGVELDDATSSTLKLKWDERVYNGISGSFSEEALNVLRAQEEVDAIYEDIEMYTSALVQQSNAPWGIARLSTAQGSFAGNDPSQLGFPFIFDDLAGANTDLYVIDTGVRVTHADFTGRATFLASFGQGVPGEDLNGHGTHCAGSAAGNALGVAKNANIFGVKVMGDDGSGATSDIISGINVSVQSALERGLPSVISMSLGGPENPAIDQAVSNGIAAGVPFTIAAGNETQDANNVSPARVPEAITVGATNINDEIASFSNFGDKVDIFAPGETIISAGIESDTSLSILSGTSMATPHVAGLALALMALEGKLEPAALSDRLVGLSIDNIIGGVPGGTPNELAFNGNPVAQQ